MTSIVGTARDHLRAFVERIERLDEERKSISDDIRDVFAEAKANGFDVKALRAIVRLRKQDPQARAEHEAILGVYLVALGMVDAGGEPTPAARQHLSEMAAKQKRKERADA